MNKTSIGRASGRRTETVDMELAYRDDIEPVARVGNRDEAMIGSGDGRLNGRAFSGSIRWTLYSGDCAYLLVRNGQDPGPGRHLCTVTPVGVISTGDGAAVWFEGRGYGLRGAEPSTPHLWRLGWTVRFETKDRRYAWLNDEFGHWEGTFDERVGRARYRGQVPAAPLRKTM